MARDYAKRPKKRKKAKKGTSSWVWLLTGVMMGLVVAAVGYLKLFVPYEGSATPTPKQAEAKQSTKPKFDFYTLLPEMEVEVPEAPKKSTRQATKPSTKKPVTITAKKESNKQPSKALEAAKYRLQLASFKKYDEADSMKARLALEGIFVEIQTVKLDTGQTWYRVRTTQFEERTDALALQKNLQRQAINSMLLKENS